MDDSLLSIRCHSGTALDLCTGYWKYPQLSNPDGHNDLIKRTHKLFVFRLGYVPEVALGIKVVMNVLIYIVRLLYLKYLFSFPTNSYLRKVVFRSIIVTAISYELVCFSSLNISFPIIKIVSSIISSLLSVGVLFYFIGLDRSERRMVALTLERLKNKSL